MPAHAEPEEPEEIQVELQRVHAYKDKFQNSTSTILGSNGAISRDTDKLRLSFSSGCFAYAVTIEDVQGVKIPTPQSKDAATSDECYFELPTLQANSTYTLVVPELHYKGEKNYFLQEARIPLHTNNDTDMNSARLGFGSYDNWMYAYRVNFKAEGGSLNFYAYNNKGTITIWKPDGKKVGDVQIKHNAVTSIPLPGSGSYVLTTQVQDDYGFVFYIEGPGLDIDTEKPSFSVPDMPLFMDLKETWTFAIGKHYDKLEIIIDDTIAYPVPEIKNSFTFSLNPASLKEGIHKVTFHGIGINEEELGRQNTNEMVTQRFFLIDRENSFRDVPRGYWARRNIEVMHGLELVSGRTKESFQPKNQITREEYAVILARTLELAVPKLTSGKSPYTDVSYNRWSAPYIAALHQAGLSKGVGQGLFEPTKPITREEAFTMLGNSPEFSNMAVPSDDEIYFVDYDQTHAWAKTSLKKLYVLGLVEGDEDWYVRTRGFITRAEATVLLSRYIGVE